MTDSSDTCEICDLYKEAAKLPVQKICCPRCGTDLCESGDLNYADDCVVGEDNSGDKHQNMRHMSLVQCRKCGLHLEVKLIPVVYNGNHDIYYTRPRWMSDADWNKFLEAQKIVS